MLVHNHCQGLCVQRSLELLGDKRNLVQHYLTSVPAYPFEEGHEGPDRMYECTRLAARMYSLLVIFPVHHSTAPFGLHTSLLLKELSHFDAANISAQESKLFVWVLVMGAIMAVGTPDRFWFISALRPVASRLRLNSWEDMKALLVTFLWLDLTNDPDGRDVWDEVSMFQNLRKAVPNSTIPLRLSTTSNRSDSNFPAIESKTQAADRTISTIG